jgi:hypothetical protein
MFISTHVSACYKLLSDLYFRTFSEKSNFRYVGDLALFKIQNSIPKRNIKGLKRCVRKCVLIESTRGRIRKMKVSEIRWWTIKATTWLYTARRVLRRHENPSYICEVLLLTITLNSKTSNINRFRKKYLRRTSYFLYLLVIISFNNILL